MRLILGYDFQIILIHLCRKVFKMNSRKNMMCALVVVLLGSPAMARAESGQANSASSALVVYSDRYVPDSVRAKYHLQDQAEPQSLQAPEAAASPQLVIESPVAQTGQDKVTTQGSVVESWRARKGERLQDVLRRWGERHAVDVKWNSSNALVVGKDFTFMGTFEAAVDGILKENAGDSLKSRMTETSTTK